MDPSHIHLLLNHVPILGTIFGTILLTYGFVKRNRVFENTGLVTVIIVALLTIPTFLSGEIAEESVEDIVGISETLIEKHEDIASVGLWIMIATGILALYTMIQTRKTGRNIFLFITLVLSIVTFAIMTIVGNSGGKIRHSQLRDSAIEINYDQEKNYEDDD